MSTGLKLCIARTGRKSVLETLDELDVIGKTFTEDGDEDEEDDSENRDQ
jgi:hypothetical protein